MRIVLLIISGWLSINLSHANDFYPLKSSQKQAQFEQLLKQLRCLVCQNQDLSDSQAPLAKDLRQQVYRLVRQDKTDEQILSYLTDRYGNFIRFSPAFSLLTVILWTAPGLLLLLGILLFWRLCIRS